MRIVQSLWSPPALQHGGYEHYHGHWPHPRYFFLSWVISTGWAQRHYGDVELVADDEGARWLVDKLKLPFSRVRTDLNALKLPPRLWAAGKILTYALQEEPFFHIDGDVYLAGRIPAEYEQADIVCQFFERGDNYPGFDRIYTQTRQYFEERLRRKPSFWRFMEENVAGNCGICGGSNVPAIHRYATEVLDVLLDPQNLPVWDDPMLKHGVNCVLEQQALCCSAREQGIEVTSLFEDPDFLTPAALKKKALYTHFNHAAVEGKNPYFGEELARLAEREFPEQCRVLDEIFPKKLTPLAMPTAIRYDEPGETPEKGEGPMLQVEAIQIKPKGR